MIVAGRIAAAWRRWVAFLDRREAPTALAVCRIVIATTVLRHMVRMWLTGTALAVWVDVRFGGIRSLDPGVMDWIGGCTPHAVEWMVAATIVASALMSLGLFTRVAAVATFVCFRTLTITNDMAGGSSDELILNVLFFLMFADSGAALSLDAAWRGKAKALVPAWPRYLVIGQLVVMYSMTGLQKVSAGWVPGGPLDALWYILQQPTWQRADMRWIARLYPLTQLGTLVTWLFENGAPILPLAFWFRATRERPGRVRAWFNRWDVRAIYLAIGFVLHLGIFLTLEVGPFLGGVLACYAACFSPAEWQAALDRVRRRTGAKQPAPSTAVVD